MVNCGSGETGDVPAERAFGGGAGGQARDVRPTRLDHAPACPERIPEPLQLFGAGGSAAQDDRGDGSHVSASAGMYSPCGAGLVAGGTVPGCPGGMERG